MVGQPVNQRDEKVTGAHGWVADPQAGDSLGRVGGFERPQLAGLAIGRPHGSQRIVKGRVGIGDQRL
jgi:hypothetical protein